MTTGHSPIDDGGALFWFYILSRYSVGLLQLISGIFLLAAVFLIRSFLIEQGLKDQVNHKAMMIHSVSFSLYNLAIAVYYVVYFFFEANQNASTWQYALIAWISTTYTNFAAQLCLIWIFLQFRNKKSAAVSDVNMDDVRCSIVRIEEYEEVLPLDNITKTGTESFTGDEPELQSQNGREELEV